MNIKFDYCKCIRIYEKAHLRSDFWQSKYILQKYYFDGGQKFMHVSYNEWSLQIHFWNSLSSKLGPYFSQLILILTKFQSKKSFDLIKLFSKNMYSIDCASLCSTSEVMLLTTKYIRDDWILHVRLNELDWMDWFLLCFVMCHVSIFKLLCRVPFKSLWPYLTL